MHTVFADLLGAAGLSGAETAVIYEDAMNNGYGQSCRGYFLLKYLGYPSVSILHGGYKAWTDAGLPTTTDVPTPEKKTFPLAVEPEMMVTTPEMLKSLDDPNVVKLDVRDWVEWIGESSSPYGVDFTPRKGRIPGAVLIEWYALMDPASDLPRFKSPEEIKEIAAEVGIHVRLHRQHLLLQGSTGLQHARSSERSGHPQHPCLFRLLERMVARHGPAHRRRGARSRTARRPLGLSVCRRQK